MSQLDTAIQTLVDEHGTFITKAQDYHQRDGGTSEQLTSDAITLANEAELARDGAQAEEATAGQHEADAKAAYDSTDADQRAAHAAKRQAEEEVAQAKRARLHAEAVQAGDLDRYTQWLLDSPVAAGTLHLTFCDPRPATGPTLALDFTTQSYVLYEEQPSYRVYE